jgi:hypothetical protein
MNLRRFMQSLLTLLTVLAGKEMYKPKSGLWELMRSAITTSPARLATSQLTPTWQSNRAQATSRLIGHRFGLLRAGQTNLEQDQHCRHKINAEICKAPPRPMVLFKAPATAAIESEGVKYGGRVFRH